MLLMVASKSPTLMVSPVTIPNPSVKNPASATVKDVPEPVALVTVVKKPPASIAGELEVG